MLPKPCSKPHVQLSDVNDSFVLLYIFRYRDALVTCEVEEKRIESVAMVTDPCKNVAHAWKVMIPKTKKKKKDIVACVALPTSYHNFQELREFIEVNKMFGFDHFAIYYNRIGNQFDN